MTSGAPLRARRRRTRRSAFEDSSSAEFTAGGVNGGRRRCDSPLTGPLNAQAALTDQGDNLRIKGSHDGYMTHFGVSHARQILVAPTGLLISSEDKLSAPKGIRSLEGLIAGDFAIRFHLHPSVRAELAPDGRERRSDAAQRRDVEDQLQRAGDRDRGERVPRRCARAAADHPGRAWRRHGRGERGRGMHGALVDPDKSSQLPQAPAAARPRSIHEFRDDAYERGVSGSRV